MRTMTILGLVAVVGLFASVASADVITQTMTITSNYPPNTYTQDFNYFDNHGGTWVLNSVTIKTSLEAWGGYYAVDNDNATATSGEARRGVSAVVTSDGPRLAPVTTSLSAYTSKTFNLDGTRGDTVGEYNAPTPPDVTAPDWDSLAGPDYAGRSIQTSGPVAATFLSDFVGLGTFEITFENAQYVSFDGLGNLWTTSGAGESAGQVEIVYNYTVVPEPATMSLLGLGGLMMFIRRRRSA